MKQFLHEDFLLTNATAKKLFHEVAKKMPIIDYHCHINPKDIWDDVHYENITRLWICDNGFGDHYKWRLMRSCGIDEKYITGDASDYEKFEKWAETLERCIGNPVYSFSHLELNRYFGYEGILNKSTCKKVWDLCNSKLADLSARSIIKLSKVKLLCTTDDPIDSLEYHSKLSNDQNFNTQVLPAFRPDKAMNLETDFYLDYLEQLSRISSIPIISFNNLTEALSKRIEFFNNLGCRTSDHALEYIMYAPASENTIEEIFKKRLENKKLTSTEINQFKTAFMMYVAKEYKKFDWGMQLHYGCKRNNNSSQFAKLGPDSGYDTIFNYSSSIEMANFFDALQIKNDLPKTIVYSLNPTDNASIINTLGCFQETKRGKMQHGSAWWFNDHKKGMLDQMTTLASNGVLGNFIGMLTDSRSFLSYSRHEYFRRLLCNLIGEIVESGEYPNDEAILKNLVEDISYNNVLHYFNFDLK